MEFKMLRSKTQSGLILAPMRSLLIREGKVSFVPIIVLRGGTVAETKRPHLRGTYVTGVL